jgi:hypothetical protein
MTAWATDPRGLWDLQKLSDRAGQGMGSRGHEVDRHKLCLVDFGP